MTYKQIEASREIRLWIGQIIVPAATLTTTVILANPEYRQAVATKWNNIKDSARNKFRKD